MKKPLIWAHRGASFHAPENTLPAFQLAADMKADGVELDVHLSADGELIVAHDETVDRCTSSTGRIIDMTLHELKELDFSNHKEGYRSVRVPTLAEVYALLKPTGLEINVEIKNNALPYVGIEQKCIDLARSVGMADRVYYSSFNHYALLALKAIDPTVRTAPLYGECMVDPWVYAKTLGAQAIHPFHRTINFPEYLPLLKASGLLVNPWTVDDEADIERLMRGGANAIITNRPDIAFAVRARIG